MQRSFRRSILVAVLAGATALAVAVPALAQPVGSAAVAGNGPAAPAGDDFYTAPSPLPAGRPGDVVRWRPSGKNAWQIMYLSTNALGRPDVVTGTVLLPAGVGDPSKAPLVAYAPGTQGPAFKCVSSKNIATGIYDEMNGINDALNRGYAVVVTDYEGYSTTTTPTYITGRSEGPAVLDSIRAAQRLAVAGLGPTSPVVISGYSQGGGASMWAAELLPTYAPELRVVGATAGGVPADLTGTAEQLDGSVSAAFLFMAAVGLDAAYPELHLDSYLNSAGRTAIKQLKAGCQEILQYAGKKISDYTTSNPLDTAAWKARLAQNKLGGSPPRIPVFMFHGALDEIVPLAQAKDLYAGYCRAGVTISYRTYIGVEHVATYVASKTEVQNFMADRFAGRPAVSTCRP